MSLNTYQSILLFPIPVPLELYQGNSLEVTWEFAEGEEETVIDVTGDTFDFRIHDMATDAEMLHLSETDGITLTGGTAYALADPDAFDEFVPGCKTYYYSLTWVRSGITRTVYADKFNFIKRKTN